METQTPPTPPSPAEIPDAVGTKDGPPAKSKNWLLISLVILVVLLSFGTAAFFAYQYVQLKKQASQIKTTPLLSPSPTANLSRDEVPRDWKTYINDTLGFSYQYPNDWQQVDSLDLFAVSNKKDGTIIQTHRYQVSDLPKGYSSVAIWFNDLRSKNQKAILPNDGYYYGPGGDNPFKWYMYYKMDNFQDTKIDNISAIITSNTGTGFLYIIVPTNNYVYEIVVNPISAYETSTVNQILSTFKFTQ